MNATPLDAVLHSYPLQFFAYDFPSLLTNASRIDERIQLDGLDRLLLSFSTAGAEVIGNTIREGGRAYTVSFSTNFLDREVIYHIVGLTPSTRSFRLKGELNEFGNTSSVTILGPIEIRKFAEHALPEIVKIFEAAYRALEEAYLTQYLRWRFSLLDEVYSIANAHLRIAGRESLIGRYWFSVTDLSRNRFRYHFDRQAIEKAIAWFKDHPESRVCGFYGLTSLILEEPDDGVFAAAEFNTHPVKVDQTTVLLRLSNLPHVQHRLEFAVAERDIYGEDEMACIDIVTQDGVSLQLNCPASGYSEYQYAMESAAEDIKQRFILHRKKHRRDLRAMDKALTRLTTTSSHWLREVGTDFAAKLAAEMLGPG